MRLVDGTYQADSSRPSAVSMATSWCGMPSEDSWIAQRGAWVGMRPSAKRHDAEQREDGSGRRASRRRGRRASRAPAGAARAAGRAIAVSAGGDEQQAAGDHADAGDVGPVGARVDDVQAVRDDAKPSVSRPMTTPSTSRVGG